MSAEESNKEPKQSFSANTRSVEESESAPESPPTEKDIEVGIQPWICVTGSFLYLTTGLGFLMSIGTIQSYLELNQLSTYSTSEVGWIIGVYSFLSFFCGMQVGPLLDYYGVRVMAPASIALSVPMFFLLAECEEYWQFMLCLGVLGGIGAGTTAMTAVATTGKIFRRRRGLAMGCTLSGASLGGVVLPLLLRHTFDHLGWKWSLRIIGFLCLGIMAIGWLCLSPAYRLIPLHRTTSGGSRFKEALPNLEPFKSSVFSALVFGFFMLEFAIIGFNSLLPTFALKAGFPADTGYIVLALSNACAIIGRILPGLLGDFVGHYNVLLITLPFTSILTGALFVPQYTDSVAPLYAFGCIWGFGTGSWLATIPVCISKTCEPKVYGRYQGTSSGVASIAAFIATATLGKLLETAGHVAASSLFLSVILIGGISIYISRALLIRKPFDLTTRV